MRQLRALFDKLLVKNTPWFWSKQCQASFEQVKVILKSDLLLTHFDPQHPIKVAADASSYGIGAVILHCYPDNTEKVISHAARSLTVAEQKYSQIEKEALALIFAVTKFHRMLHGRKFTLCTDHKPLISVFGSKKGIPVHTANRLQRWALTLLAYDFDIQHINTEKFGHADVLSRLMNRNQPVTEDYVIASVSIIEADVQQILIEAVRNLPVTCEMIRKATAEDPVLQTVASYIKTTWPTSKIGKDIQLFYNRRDSLMEINGCLLMSERLVIPFMFQKRILNQLHVGHPGIVRMKALARSYVYWPNLDSEVESMVKQCSQCASVAKAPIKTTLASWPLSTKPWQRIHIDYAGPFEGHNFLVIVDSFSKWPEIFIQTTTTSTATIAKLREIFSRFGSPETIVSDNGTQFTSHQFQQFCETNGVEHIRSPPFHPQSNGQAERFVDTFKRALSKMKGEEVTSDCLQTFLRCYRTTPNAALPNNVTPAEQMFGRKIRIPLDLLRPVIDTNDKFRQRNYSMESRFNQQHGAVKREFYPDDLVYVMDYSTPKRSWVPAIIINRCGNTIYSVKIGQHIHRRHTNQIRSRSLKDNTDTKDKLVAIPFDMLVDTFNVPKPNPISTNDSTNSVVKSPPLPRRNPVRQVRQRLQSRS